ncbi:MAG: twin-arginine translocase TatA/TatE family subunit [Phototrophicaceae bacterium]
MGLGPVELGIILAIVVLLFGVGRLSNIGSELGSAIRNFREGVRSESDKKEDPKPETTRE